MKKLVAALAMGVIVAGTAATSVSAETHEVKKGDSLWDIADQYETTVDELVQINELKTTIIQPKQKLFINSEYIVEKGDTLIDIGKDYDVSVANLKKWNGLKSDIIAIGQELEIKGVNVEQEEAPATEVTNATKEKKQENTQSSEQKTQKNKSEETSKKENNTQEKPSGKTISVSSTAYTASCDGCSGVTSTGVDLNKNPNAKVIAVDPNVIPLGTEVYVEGYGYATAADVGSAINGNEIDVYVPTKDKAYSWGVRTVNVTIVE